MNTTLRRLASKLGEHGLGIGVLAVTAAIYAVSLGGDWVWDDVPQFRDNPVITQPGVLLTNDIWGPLGRRAGSHTPAYRPLAMLSHVPGQTFARGPAIERAINLALQLGIVAALAGLGLALGGSRRAAWFGAALLGWHPAVTESVAWISCRGELMGSGLVWLGMWALARDRPGWAGLALAIAPFCKETFVVAPLALLVWMIALRKRAPLALGMSVAGSAAYLGVRIALDFAVPNHAGAAGPLELLGATGAVAVRGLELLALPGAPDVAAPYLLRPIAGAVTIAALLALCPALPGRPALGALFAPLPFLALAVPASFGNALVADRYFYVGMIGIAAAAGCLYAALEARQRWTPLLFLLPLVCVPFAAQRASEWSSNRSLWQAAYERHPEDPEVLFHLGYHHHVTARDCSEAVLWYERARHASRRAGNNLQACLLELQRYADAARLGPELAESDPANPNPALNTARAFLMLARPDLAQPWALEAVERAPERSSSYEVLGKALGMRGQHRNALTNFERALRLDPSNAEAQRGLGIAKREIAHEQQSVKPEEPAAAS